MFRKVAARVYETTRGKQVPELSISLLSEVFLNRNETEPNLGSRAHRQRSGRMRDFLAASEQLLCGRCAHAARLLDRKPRASSLIANTRTEGELRDRLAALEVERLSGNEFASSRARPRMPRTPEPGAGAARALAAES